MTDQYDDDKGQTLLYVVEDVAAFDVRHAAPLFEHAMNKHQLPLTIRLEKCDIEFELGCTAKEIIETYDFVVEKITSEKKPSPPASKPKPPRGGPLMN